MLSEQYSAFVGWGGFFGVGGVPCCGVGVGVLFWGWGVGLFFGVGVFVFGVGGGGLVFLLGVCFWGGVGGFVGTGGGVCGPLRESENLLFSGI